MRPAMESISRFSYKILTIITVLLSAVMLKHVAITPRIVGGTVLTVAGVALVLAG